MFVEGIETGTGELVEEEFDGMNASVSVDSSIDIPYDEIISHLRNSPEMAAISNWVSNIHSYQDATGRRKASLIQRDKYITPPKIFDKFSLAAEAARTDDVVSGVVDSTESLAFSKVKFDHPDEEQEDLWNQLAKTWKFDALLRKMWRDLFIYSQFVVVSYPGTHDLKVRGKTKLGNRRRKPFDGVKAPAAFSLIDPCRVVPFGNLMFGKEQLAYIPKNEMEAKALKDVLADRDSDDPARYMLLRELPKDTVESLKLGDLTDTGQFSIGTTAFEMNPNNVWRHTDTRADYQRWAEPKMVSIFELLDLKSQLRQNDRAVLIGASNFIVVIKKGSDNLPAKRDELNALKSYAKSLARMPLIIGDHRLSVEIIAPNTDNILKPERYNSLNAAITTRLYMFYSAGNYSSGTKGDTSITLTRMAAKGLESRRQMVKRSIEEFVIDKIMDANDDLIDAPDLRFQPASIALEFDAARAQFMLDLRARNELSRETILTEMDFDQDDEAQRIEQEKEKYDPIFQTINPFNQGKPGVDGPSNDSQTDTKQAGRNLGGNRKGGGDSPGSGQREEPRGAPKPKKTE